MKQVAQKKWALIVIAVCTVLFGQDVVVAIIEPIVTAVGGLLPAR